MNWNNAERERIIEQALSAFTWPEVQQATQELQQWTRTYPQDLGIVDMFEVLFHKQDFAEDQNFEMREAAATGHMAGTKKQSI